MEIKDGQIYLTQEGNVYIINDIRGQDGNKLNSYSLICLSKINQLYHPAQFITPADLFIGIEEKRRYHVGDMKEWWVKALREAWCAADDYV